MSTDEHDLEYGPNPPGAGYEHTDIDPSIGYTFAVWLAVAMLISGAIVYGTFWLFNGQQQVSDQAAQKYPLAVGRQSIPPGPRLQTQPFKDIHLLRQSENARLEGYGWVDQAAGVTRIPIERAMDLTIQRGLPASAEVPAGLNMLPEDSSGGRTLAPR